MRAAYLNKHGGPEVMEFGELPDPKGGDEKVIVRLKTSSLNHLDLWVRAGLPGLKLKYPHVLGADGAGIVENVGKNITEWKAGDEVILYPAVSCGQCEHCVSGIESLCDKYGILGEHVNGTNAELVEVSTRQVFRKPKNLSFAEAGSFSLVFVTAWEMLVGKAEIRSGQTVLIHGLGSGVSVAGVQIAKLFGARVIVTSRSREKLKKAKALGADLSIEVGEKDFVGPVKEVCPAGVDIVFDHIGKAYWRENIKVLRKGGVLVTCGATSGFAAETDLRHVFYRQLRILGSTMGSRRDFPEILKHMESGKFKATVDKSFPIEEIVQAHQYLETQAQFGKVILTF